MRQCAIASSRRQSTNLGRSSAAQQSARVHPARAIRVAPFFDAKASSEEIRSAPPDPHLSQTSNPRVASSRNPAVRLLPEDEGRVRLFFRSAGCDCCARAAAGEAGERRLPKDARGLSSEPRRKSGLGPLCVWLATDCGCPSAHCRLPTSAIKSMVVGGWAYR